MSDRDFRVSQREYVHGGFVAQYVDMQDFPPIVGLEGPFRMGRDMSFRVLYYDTREGKYYDRKTDLYVEVG